ncbi:DgyrCDS5761 [Dimorphilus gyrociliatus]|uniref:DNA polymerase n=1 Tax=Dimorphilus gyrociliatus TaxID=2664684 RepID=A0A7I8VKV3_9ANNE|nr:DgyrCDS5761 [Dimorphilus gyrociliatus]
MTASFYGNCLVCSGEQEEIVCKILKDLKNYYYGNWSYRPCLDELENAEIITFSTYSSAKRCIGELDSIVERIDKDINNCKDPIELEVMEFFKYGTSRSADCFLEVFKEKLSPTIRKMYDAIYFDRLSTEETKSLARGRSRRQKKDKSGRLAALGKFKELKAAGKRRFSEDEDSDPDNVYDYVDEETYSNIVQSRQNDDWIVDDDGCGYVEDGREIFDEDVDDTLNSKSSKKQKNAGNQSKNKKGSSTITPTPKGTGDIKRMFLASAVSSSVKKRKKKEETVNEDDVLENLMSEIKHDSTPKTPTSVLREKQQSNPFISKPKRPKIEIKQEKPAETIQKQCIEIPDDDDDFNEVCASMEPIDDDIKPRSPKKVNKEEVIEKKVEVKAEPKLNSLTFSSDNNIDHSMWKSCSEDTEKEMETVADNGSLPTLTNEAGENIIRLYWFDAYEDQMKHPGLIYLFGKIQKDNRYVSCCITVKNIERQLFLLPRSKKYDTKTKTELDEDVSFNDIYKEFNSIADKYKIKEFKSKKTPKKYAFEKAGVPAEAEYFEVRYSADYPKLPQNISGETFICAFGTNTSSLEQLVLDRGLKGPCWLDISHSETSSVSISWCKVEATIQKPDFIKICSDSISSPPLIVLTLNVRTLPNPKTHQNEVLAASCLIQKQFSLDKPPPKEHFQEHFCAFTKPNDCILPFDFKAVSQRDKRGINIEYVSTERGLLSYLLARIFKIDPDVIVGHDIAGYDLDVILNRTTTLKVPHWSRLGRLKRSVPPKIMHLHGKATGAVGICSGRLLCDVMVSAKELIRLRSYDLNELTNSILKESRISIDPNEVKKAFDQSISILNMIEVTLRDSSFILRIMYELNILPLALQITNVCGNLMARTMLGGRSERNEFLLLHAFHERQFIVPDKFYGKKQQITNHLSDDEGEMHLDTTKRKGQQGRRKPAYTGGLVLEPKKGFYDKYILLLDFNSLYPSIIQEYNICFTTIERNGEKSIDDEEFIPDVPPSDSETGILPTEIRKLVHSRRDVKALMKKTDPNSDLYVQYDIRQKALKLTANSMYGCLGFSNSRFYAKPLASLITSKGREILLKTKDLVTNMNLEVIYGDTDSIMVNTNSIDYEDVMKVGLRVKNEVNKHYKLLEIDIDGLFKSMLLLKKKKYAALVATVGKNGEITTKQELKGLDIVRRDWCELAKTVGNFAVSEILSGKSKEEIVENIHTELYSVAEKVRNDSIGVEQFFITKQLAKNPEDYPDKKHQAHVQVALRINAKSGKKLRGGDTVFYVICEDGTSTSHSERAYHPDELAKEDNLKLDKNYYLAQQVHPVVSRLCDPIEGTDAVRIAECLGLDGSNFKHKYNQERSTEDEGFITQLSDAERFKDCQRFSFECFKCSTVNCLESCLYVSENSKDSDLTFALAQCRNEECGEALYKDCYVNIIKNKLTIEMRRHINKYYTGWLKCDDPVCEARTRNVTLNIGRAPICNVCGHGILKVEYSDKQLYDQLCFYRHIFDLEKGKQALNTEQMMRASRLMQERGDAQRSLNALRAHVDKQLQKSAYAEVDLYKLFSGLHLLSSAKQFTR